MKTKLKKLLKLLFVVLGLVSLNSLTSINNKAFSQQKPPPCNGTLVTAKDITTPGGGTTLDCGAVGTSRCCLNK